MILLSSVFRACQDFLEWRSAHILQCQTIRALHISQQDDTQARATHSFLFCPPAGWPWRCDRDCPPERRQRVSRNPGISCTSCVCMCSRKIKRDTQTFLIVVFCKSTHARLYLQGPAGPAGPTGPPGPRGYEGPKVSYSDKHQWTNHWRFFLLRDKYHLIKGLLM